MSLIQVADLTFSYEGSYDNIFENTSFQIDTSWKLGFIGRNGRGKTTFLQLLQNKYPYRGRISASVEFDYFPYPAAKPERPALAVLEEISPDSQAWEIQREISLLDLSEDVLYRPFETLSKGEQTKVLLGALFLKQGRFLLIDEPTDHLDIQARAIVSNYLKHKQGFILVSHDRNFLDGCVDHILAINKQDIQVQKGNFSSWQENKARQDAFELAENARLQREVKHLSKAAKQTQDWSAKIEKRKTSGHKISGIKADKGHIGHMAAKMMKRSKAVETRRERAFEDKSKLLQNLETGDSLFLRPLAYHKSLYLETRDLSIFYGDKPVCRELSFQVREGDRLALRGKNGSGKSSLIKLITGTEALSYQGDLAIGSRLLISYIPQDTSFLKGSLSAFAQVAGVDESLFKTILSKLGFSRIQFEKDLADFSAGQKKKVLLAQSFCRPGHLYVWDEPLNYIDVISRMQIEDLILEYEPTLIFVEHDKRFVEKIATKYLEL